MDGCFFHSWPEHGNSPRKNTAYGLPKLERNRQRDKRVTQALVEAGWTVVRIWEHVDVEDAVAVVEQALGSEPPVLGG